MYSSQVCPGPKNYTSVSSRTQYSRQRTSCTVLVDKVKHLYFCCIVCEFIFFCWVVLYLQVATPAVRCGKLLPPASPYFYLFSVKHHLIHKRTVDGRTKRRVSSSVRPLRPSVRLCLRWSLALTGPTVTHCWFRQWMSMSDVHFCDSFWILIRGLKRRACVTNLNAFYLSCSPGSLVVWTRWNPACPEWRLRGSTPLHLRNFLNCAFAQKKQCPSSAPVFMKSKNLYRKTLKIVL